MSEHWLYRPQTMSRLRICGIGLLLAVVVAELFVNLYSHFDFAGWFGFHAVFGFVTCVAMVFTAWLLGRFVRRRDDYYEADQVSAAPPGGAPASEEEGA